MQKIRIDFDNPGLPQHISAVENDSQSRFFQATLYENGKAYTAPEGATYSIMYRGFGPQNQGWYDTINDGAGKRAACSVSGNVVTCEIARQALQVPGHVSIVLCVTTGKGYMLKSWPIECDCKNDRYDSTAEIQSFFYITQVSNADWTQAIQAWENLKDAIDPTLSVSGKAADAKATGDAVGQLGGEYVGQKISFEDGIYINADSGNIKTHDLFSLSNPIKVLSGTSVTVITYCNYALGIGLLDSEENIKKVVQVTTETTNALHSKAIDIPDWCSSIRISCVKSHKNDVSYSVSSLFEYTQKRIDKTLEQINQLNKTTKKRGLMNPYEWENSSIKTQTGSKYTINTRLCTINYWKNIESIICKDGYKARVWCYKNDGTYIGGWNGSKITKSDTNFSEVKTDKIYEAGADKLLIVVLKDDGSNIAVSEISNITIFLSSNNTKDEIENEIDENKSISITPGNIEETLLRKIVKRGIIRGKYIFPKDIHSTNTDCKLMTISSDALSIDIEFRKRVTSMQDDVPQDPVPVYNAGIVIKANGTEYARLSPDGWRKEIFLGEDAMSIRFKGNCNDDGNRDIRLKIDTDNIIIYHKSGSIIANFTKSQYSTMNALYEAISKSPSMAEFEILPLHLDTLTPNDIIECDVPLVGKYYTDNTNTTVFYDAYPFYCTTKQSGKEYNIELLFDIEAAYPLQILINGFCIAKFYLSYSHINTLFWKALKITIYDNQNNEITCNSVTTNITECKSLYPNIRILYCEKIEKGSGYQEGYSISENRIEGIASKMRSIDRKYIAMKQIEDVLDGVINTLYRYYWTFQLDDGSINCVTDENLRRVLLRDGIKPSIAMMPSKDITENEYKIIKASESAGFEYHIHAPYTEPSVSIPYLTYAQLDTRVSETIEKFIEMYGSLPTVWGKHAGIYHYSTCRYLKNKGFRVIFGDNAEDTSINEVTRYACKRTLIQEQSPTYDMLSTLKNVY